jgi:hypothetical protein
MKKPLNLPRGRGSLIRVAAAVPMLLAGSRGYANILNTSADGPMEDPDASY